jgi:hypothetical protein
LEQQQQQQQAVSTATAAGVRSELMKNLAVAA